MPRKKDNIKKLTSDVAEVLGNAAGGFIGAVLAGPSGAIIGGASGTLLAKAFRNVGEEMHERFLGPREKLRTEKVMDFAAIKLQENMARGIIIRNDSSLVKVDDSGRSTAEEVLEGVLLVGQRSYEELKLKFIGNLYANVIVSTLDKYQINFLIRLAESLSYRQLCLVHFFCIQPLISGSQRSELDAAGKLLKTYFDAKDLNAEIRDIQNKGLITIPIRIGVEDLTYRIWVEDVAVTDIGNLIDRMMDLSEIDNGHLEYLRHLIKRKISE